jgi:hypothetical protein
MSRIMTRVTPDNQLVYYKIKHMILTDASREVGLKIKVEKTKYMLLSPH